MCRQCLSPNSMLLPCGVTPSPAHPLSPLPSSRSPYAICPVLQLAERMGAFTHMTTIYGGVRPFGAALLLAGADPESGKPELYCVEPSGMALRYFGAAVGKGARAAKTEIEKEKLSDMTVADAIGRVAKM